MCYTKIFLGLFSMGMLLHSTANAEERHTSGSYTLSGNVSTIGKPLRSFSHCLNMNIQPQHMVGDFDYSLEAVTEPSFHTDDLSIINEHAIETSLAYNYPISDNIETFAGFLYNKNSTLPESYTWGMLGLEYTLDLSEQWEWSSEFLVQKNMQHGRFFYDLSSQLNYHPLTDIHLSGHIHRFEELGEFDLDPTLQLEYGADLTYQLNERLVSGLSYQHHTEDTDHEGRWSLMSVSFSLLF
jgi:hypothetical protein